MVTGPTIPIFLVLWFYRTRIIAYLLAATLAVVLYDVVGIKQLAIPTTPLTIVGVALAIFLGFRTNQAYDRWWEGRKLWGRLINVSRAYSRQILTTLGPDDDDEATVMRERMIRRHIAFTHVLRCHLRSQPIADDDKCQEHLGDEISVVVGESNPPNRLLLEQALDTADAHRRGWISDVQQQTLEQSLVEMSGVQGGCERIKKTPIPVAYTYFANRIAFWFGCTLPFGLLNSLGWMVVVISLPVAMTFTVIDGVGRLIDDPFGTGYYGLPLANMSWTIETNLLERLGVERLPVMPPNIGPNNTIVM